MSARKRTNMAAAANRQTRAPSKTAVKLQTRITLDLPQDLYDELQAWRRQASVDVDANITLAKLSRALYRRLLDDPAIQQDVRAALHEQG